MPKSSFPAVTNADIRLLVLGSLPGEVSLARAQYYAHPQNQFWRLMQAVIGRPLVELAYPERLEALLEAGVGLWDVVRSAERVGSLDTAIRNLEANALADFTATLPALRAVAYNGAKASAVGRTLLGDGTAFAQITLPSSSPAHAVPFERKAAEWLRLRTYLGGGAK
ncbi:MAG: Uracil-DNA glycosylase superfamily [Caulobacter sp.]|nr:Uracil-DNA glycosylase superfamily [Caulobacter sp.]